MGRKQVKSNSRRKPSQELAETHQEHDASAAVKQDDYRFLTGLAIAGMVVAALCLLLFFQSDIREKIVASNIAAAEAEAAMIAANKPADGRDGRDGVDGEDGVPSAGDDPDTPVTDAPDEDTPDSPDDSGAGGGAGDGQGGSAGGTPDSDSGAPQSTDIVIAPGAVIDREALTGYLSQMEQADFIELAESVDLLIADDPTRVNLPERKSLAEAYAEAEALYPGQIDASKRLKLVAEINAIDFMYYIAEDGDTLLELSKSLSVPLGQLVELNGIKDADVISAGMVILVPTDMVQPE